MEHLLCIKLCKIVTNVEHLRFDIATQKQHADSKEKLYICIYKYMHIQMNIRGYYWG